MTDLPYDYAAVGREVGLDPVTNSRYVAYMKARWGDQEDLKCRTGYAKEWAERFKAKIEFGASDSTGQALLKALSPERYVPC